MLLPANRAQQRPAQGAHTGKQEIAQKPAGTGTDKAMFRLITLRLFVLWFMAVVMTMVAARGR